VVDFGSRCDAFKFDATFRYRSSDQIDDFSRTIQVRPPLEAEAIQRVFFPAYFYRPKAEAPYRSAFGLAGLEVPSSAATCVSALWRVRDARDLPLLLDLNLPPRWESATLYHTIVGWERRRGGDEQPDIYTFPSDLPVRRTTLTADITPFVLADIDQQSPTLTIRNEEWRVDGTGGVGGRGPFLYLAQMKPAIKKQGSLLLARGRIDDGGISVGLVRDGRWVAQVPVTADGEFIVVVRVPSDGSYSAVLANNLIGRSLENHVRLRRFGWIASP
jgi:hypothetical protein